MQLEIVLAKAKSLGFSSQSNQEGSWQILPLQCQEQWRLIQSDDRWILSINNVPQLNLITSEVLSFLENRYQLANVESKKVPPFYGGTFSGLIN